MNNYFNNLNPKLREYFNILSKEIPKFLYKYLDVPELQRLSGIGYLCGMDYCSKDVYDFSFYYSRLDHSIAAALITWHFTHDKKQTIAALLHDIATPIFSHVIDYKNGDTVKQETTEEHTEQIIRGSKKLLECLKQDGIDVEDVIDCKKYSIVDNDRPKLCADRLDSIFMGNLLWTKKTDIKEIKHLYKNISVMNEEGKPEELGTESLLVARRITDLSIDFGYMTNLESDYLCMQLMAYIIESCEKKGYISESMQNTIDEPTAIDIIENIQDEDLLTLWRTFENIKRIETTDTIEKIDFNNFYVIINEIKKKWVDILIRISGRVVKVGEIDSYCNDVIEEYKDHKTKQYAFTKRYVKKEDE